MDERQAFAAVVYVLTSGCAWRMLDELGARGEIGWTSAIVDAPNVRAKKGARRPARLAKLGVIVQADRLNQAPARLVVGYVTQPLLPVLRILPEGVDQLADRLVEGAAVGGYGQPVDED